MPSVEVLLAWTTLGFTMSLVILAGWLHLRYVMKPPSSLRMLLSLSAATQATVLLAIALFAMAHVVFVLVLIMVFLTPNGGFGEGSREYRSIEGGMSGFFFPGVIAAEEGSFVESGQGYFFDGGANSILGKGPSFSSRVETFNVQVQSESLLSSMSEEEEEEDDMFEDRGKKEKKKATLIPLQCVAMFFLVLAYASQLARWADLVDSEDCNTPVTPVPRYDEPEIFYQMQLQQQQQSRRRCCCCQRLWKRPSMPAIFFPAMIGLLIVQEVVATGAIFIVDWRYHIEDGMRGSIWKVSFGTYSVCFIAIGFGFLIFGNRIANVILELPIHTQIIDARRYQILVVAYTCFICCLIRGFKSLSFVLFFPSFHDCSGTNFEIDLLLTTVLLDMIPSCVLLHYNRRLPPPRLSLGWAGAPDFSILRNPSNSDHQQPRS